MLFSAELPWCCFMCRKEKFSECPGNPRRHFSDLIRIFGKRISARGPTACPQDRGARPPISWAPWTPSDLNSNSIYSVSGRKNQRESFIAFHDTEPPPSPNLSREGWSGVRSGLRRGGFIVVVIINHPPSPISWCSPPCVSNSIVGLLDGDGLDEIYHVIELVLLGFDP